MRNDMDIIIKKTLRNRLILLIACLCLIPHFSFSPAAAQTVNMQSAINDSTYLNLRLSYSSTDKSTLTLKTAYLTTRGSLKRTPIECKGLRYEFGKSADAVSFQFSLNFTHSQRRYQAHGSYAAGADDDTPPDCTLRCVPLRLSDKTLRESEYSPTLR